MNYQTSKSITVEDAVQSLKFIAGTLTAAGFSIQEWKENGLTATGPAMMSSNQNPLSAVMQLSIKVQGSNLSAEADVGARKLIGILSVVFTCMAAMFAVMAIFMLPSHDKNGHTMSTGIRLLIAVGPILPLVIVLPIVYRASIKTGRRAIDTLLHNASMMPGPVPRI